MAKITDPDLLNQGTEVVIDTSAKTIQLAVAGNLTNIGTGNNTGVTLQCLYSFLKEEWKSDANLIKFPFPMTSITNEQFEVIDGWDFADQNTKDLVRDGGWALTESGVVHEEYMCVTTLGSFDNNTVDQAYYLQDPAGAPVDIVLPGEVNQAIKIFGDATHDDFDYKDIETTNVFQLFLREQGKTYAFGDLFVDQSVSSLTYKKYAMPLSNAPDLKISETDENIGTNTPYTGMSITWGSQSFDIGGSSRDFSVVIDANNATAEEVYEFVQYELRQVGDIDAGAGDERGDISEELLVFVGSTLKTKLTSSGGVYINNFQAIDTNRLVFVDDTGVERTYPYVASGKISFNDNLQNDASANYWMFFTNDDAATVPAGNNFNTSGAIIVKDNSNTDISGSVSGQTEKSFDFDYDGNIQRGAGSAGKDAPVTIIASGLGTAQYVKATGTIIRSNANNFSLVSALERNYAND